MAQRPQGWTASSGTCSPARSRPTRPRVLRDDDARQGGAQPPDQSTGATSSPEIDRATSLLRKRWARQAWTAEGVVKNRVIRCYEMKWRCEANMVQFRASCSGHVASKQSNSSPVCAWSKSADVRVRVFARVQLMSARTQHGGVPGAAPAQQWVIGALHRRQRQALQALVQSQQLPQEAGLGVQVRPLAAEVLQRLVQSPARARQRANGGRCGGRGAKYAYRLQKTHTDVRDQTVKETRQSQLNRYR